MAALESNAMVIHSPILFSKVYTVFFFFFFKDIFVVTETLLNTLLNVFKNSLRLHRTV